MLSADLTPTALAMTARGTWSAERGGIPVGRIERINRRYVVISTTGRHVGRYWEFGQAQRALDRHVDHVVRHAILIGAAVGTGLAAGAICFYAIAVLHLF